MADVFISYSRRNSDFARRLAGQLTRMHKESWVDWEDIPLTAPNWWEEIKAGIANADNFIFIMSPESMASVVCNMELDYAFELNKRIIPVVYREVHTQAAFATIADFEPDEAMAERLAGHDPLVIARDNWHRISHINWAFFRESDDFDEAFEQLVKTVETDLEYVKAHTRYLVRAQEWERKAKRPDLLLFGEEIDLAEAWLQTGQQYAASAAAGGTVDVVNPVPQPLHMAYITASRQADERRRRIARSTQVILVTLVAALLIGGGIAASIITTTNETIAAGETQIAAANRANTQSAQLRLDAEDYATSLQIAAQAQDVRADTPFIGLRLAYEASLIDTPPRTQRILADLAYAPGARLRFEGAEYPMMSLAPSPDGRLLVTAHCGFIEFFDCTGAAGELRLWDAATGELLRRFDTQRGIVSVAFSPDGTQVVSGSLANIDNAAEMILWDVETGEIAQQYEIPQYSVQALAFSPDGVTLAAAMGNPNLVDEVGQLLLYEVATGDLVREFEIQSGSIQSVAFSPDGQFILSGAEAGDFENAGAILLWEAATGDMVRRYEGHTGGVVSHVAFSPDGAALVAGAIDEIFLWDTASGALQQRFVGHAETINSVAFAPNGEQIASAGAGGEIILWDTETGNILERLTGHDSAISDIAFVPQDGRLISASFDDTAFVWDGRHGALLRQLDLGESVDVVAYSPLGDTFLTASGFGDSVIAIWDAETGRLQRELIGSARFLNAAIFSPDGAMVATGAGFQAAGELLLWDVATGAIIRRYEGHTQDVNSIAFSPDGTLLLSGAGQPTLPTPPGELFLWDVATGEYQSLNAAAQHPEAVNRVAFSPDGTTFISGAGDGAIILWDAATATPIQQLALEEVFIASMDYHPDGNIVAIAASDTVRLWDIPTGAITGILRSSFLHDVAFSPDGETLISVGQDQRVMMWEVASGEIIRAVEVHGDAVGSVAFAPDGKTFITGSSDETAILWRNDGLQDLQQWALANRYMPELTCAQRDIFGLPPCLEAD